MSFDTLKLFFSKVIISCYFIVLVLFHWLVWYFGYNSAISLFIYLSLFTIIILFRLNHFIY